MLGFVLYLGVEVVVCCWMLLRLPLPLRLSVSITDHKNSFSIKHTQVNTTHQKLSHSNPSFILIAQKSAATKQVGRQVGERGPQLNSTPIHYHFYCFRTFFSQLFHEIFFQHILLWCLFACHLVFVLISDVLWNKIKRTLSAKNVSSIIIIIIVIHLINS